MTVNRFQRWGGMLVAGLGLAGLLLAVPRHAWAQG